MNVIDGTERYGHVMSAAQLRAALRTLPSDLSVVESVGTRETRLFGARGAPTVELDPAHSDGLVVSFVDSLSGDAVRLLTRDAVRVYTTETTRHVRVWYLDDRGDVASADVTGYMTERMFSRNPAGWGSPLVMTERHEHLLLDSLGALLPRGHVGSQHAVECLDGKVAERVGGRTNYLTLKGWHERHERRAKRRAWGDGQARQ
jgi:hypothetical protein